MLVPNRQGSTPAYRYGFGGHEKIDELKGDGNHLDFGDYGYDPRIGRRWNIDPLFRIWQSPYATFNNNPIVFADPNGLEGVPKQKEVQKGDTFYDIAKNSDGAFTVNDLIKWNPGVNPKNLKIGSKINVSNPNSSLKIGTGGGGAMLGEQGASHSDLYPISNEINDSEEMDDSVGELQTKMLGALHLGTIGKLDNEASKLVMHFMIGNGEDRVSKTIAEAMINESQVQDMFKNIRKQFQTQMILTKGNYNEISLRINELPSFGKSDPQLLTLVGGTQQLDLFLNNITVNGNNYSAEIGVNLIDTFGVDEADVIKPLASFVAGKGLRAMWILQHRHNFKPFRSIFKFKLKLNGSF